jgi:myo-inositol-1(or 4)-monophosphatase
MSQLIGWPVPGPRLPAAADRVLAAATEAAVAAFRAARSAYDRAGLAEKVQMGADGTASMRLDILVETAVAEVAAAHRVNLLSEEIGFVDNGSAVTLVADPVDGTANAAAGVPLSAFSAALVLDGIPVEALTCWLDTGRCWHAAAGQPSPYRTTGRTELDGAAVSLLRPHPGNPDAAAAWWRVAGRAARGS